jgi:transcriptional regulator with XRE-family HTH domain
LARAVLQSPILPDRVIFEKAELLRLDYQLKQSVIARRLGISMSHLTRVLRKERANGDNQDNQGR